MGVSLVTGGSGFIGTAVARALLERGDDVRVTVRKHSPRDGLTGLDVHVVEADVTDRRALGRALRGVERLFHCAGVTSLRASLQELRRVDVDGTRNVMEGALRAGVDRAVHVSSFAAIGPAPRGRTADETHAFTGERLGLPYVTAKREAEAAALAVAARGLDVVVGCPGLVFGRGDLHRSSTELVRRYLRGEVLAYVEGAVNIVDVQDVAAGLLLVDAFGRSGERYLLGNRNFTLDRLLADLGRMSGIEPPALCLPLPAAIGETELRAMGQWWTYRSTKAKRELGFKPSHHETTLEETIAWYREREPLRMKAPGHRQPFVLRAGGFGVRQLTGVAARMGL